MASQMYTLSSVGTFAVPRWRVHIADNRKLLAWMSLLLMAPCTFLTWPVTCQKLDLPSGSTYFSQLTHDIVVAQLKARILRGMNRSEPPHNKMTPIHKAYSPDNNPRLVFLSYHAPHLKSKDVVSFKVSPCVWSHIEDVGNAFVAFYVRSIGHGFDDTGMQKRQNIDRKKTRQHKLMKKNARLKRRLLRCKHKFKRLHQSIAEQNNTVESGDQSSNLSKQENSVTSSMPVNATLIRSSEKSLSLNQSRGQRVKIVVRVMNTTTERKRNIAVKQMEVKSRMLMLITVPVKYLRRIADSQDQTMSLQIVCRGCSKRAWIESVYTRQRRHGKKKAAEKMLNINRPILFIDMKNSTCTDQLWNNLEPESYSTSLDWVNISQADAWALPRNASSGQNDSVGDD